jgi:7-cyano-7-deazaguanine synthase
MSTTDEHREIAILISGGIDSAILLSEAVGERPAVHPLYLRSGHYWEEVERAHLAHFLEAVRASTLRPVQVLDAPVGDLYANHWSVTGRGAPGADASNESVDLPGRNVLLLSKALVWCHLRGVPELALAVLKGNPFADATQEFFEAFQGAVNRAIGGSMRVVRPFSGLSKAEVMRRGRDLPLERTFSCIRPRRGLHCGRCSKCAERRRAFDESGIADRTEYADAP